MLRRWLPLLLLTTACPGDAAPEPIAKRDAEAVDAKTDDAKTDDTKSDDTKSGDTKTDDTKSDDTKPDDTKPDDTKPDAPEPETPAPIPESVVVADDAGLQLYDVATGTKSTAFAGNVGICLTHPAAEAIWFLGRDDEAPTFTLYAIDTARGPTPIPIATDVPESVAALAITTWHGGTVQSDAATDFELGLTVDLRAVPTAKRLVGCDGEMFDCFDETTDALEPGLETTAVTIDAVRVTDPGNAKRIGDRAPAVPDAEPPAPLPALKVDRTGCAEIPEECGKRVAIPGTALQLVVTGNERGDLFHEMLQLYDPKAATFMPLSDPRKTAKTPHPEGTELSHLYVPASGSAYATDFEVVHLTRGPVVADVSVCGFTTAGAVLTGITK